MEKLPLEITANIFYRLPIISQLQCREVSKTWQTLVPKPKTAGLLYGVSSRRSKGTKVKFYFSEQNDKVGNTNHVDDDEQVSCFGTITKLDNSLITPGAVFQSFMVGSCSGLVCYAANLRTKTKIRETRVYICNPVTEKHIQLPTGKDQARTTYGFGYVRSTDEYMFVSIACDESPFQVGMVKVFTFRAGGGGGAMWRKMTIGKHLLSHLRVFPLAGVFAGGALYWMDEYTTIVAYTLAFDLKHETFELLPPIPCKYYFRIKNGGLVELGGNLCAIEVDHCYTKKITIWELSRFEGIRYWIAKFNINATIAWEDYSQFKLTNSHIVSLWYNVILSCYDPETKTLREPDEILKKLKDDDFTRMVYTTTRATPHVNSLVSLKGVTGEKGKKCSPGNRKRKTHCY